MWTTNILSFIVFFPFVSRGTALDVTTRQLFNIKHSVGNISAPKAEDNSAEICTVVPNSEMEVVLSKGIFLFLLSTTVVTFVVIATSVISLFVYYWFCTRRKCSCSDAKMMCNCCPTFLLRQNKQTINHSVKHKKKGSKDNGYCDHCVGPCCRLPIVRQGSIARHAPASRRGGTMNSIRSNSSGFWKNTFDATNKSYDYSFNDDRPIYLQ